MTASRLSKGDRSYLLFSAGQRSERFMAIAERLDCRPGQVAKAVCTEHLGIVLSDPQAVEGRHLLFDLRDALRAEIEGRG